MRLFGKWFGKRASRVPSHEENMARQAKFEQLVRTPDFAMVAEVLGEVPPSLRSLYQTEMILQNNLIVATGKPEEFGAHEVAYFEALRPEWREHMWPELRTGCLTFAADGLGNHFFLKANTGPEWPVYFYDHEGGQMTLIAQSLDEFLNLLQPDQDGE